MECKKKLLYWCSFVITVYYRLKCFHNEEFNSLVGILVPQSKKCQNTDMEKIPHEKHRRMKSRGKWYNKWVQCIFRQTEVLISYLQLSRVLNWFGWIDLVGLCCFNKEACAHLRAAPLSSPLGFISGLWHCLLSERNDFIYNPEIDFYHTLVRSHTDKWKTPFLLLKLHVAHKQSWGEEIQRDTTQWHKYLTAATLD